MPVERGREMAVGELAERERSLEAGQVAVLGRLTDLLVLRDPGTGVHSRRIGAYAAGLASAWGLSAGEVRDLARAAPLHDVGKLAIPDAILLKPGPLDPAERELMRRHARIGHDLLAGTGAPLLDLAAEIALTHHERFDGGGYPDGLAGGAIPLAGRIVAVADSFDFLVSDRPYHEAVTPARALAALLDEGGGHFDPALLDRFAGSLVPILTQADRAPGDGR